MQIGLIAVASLVGVAAHAQGCAILGGGQEVQQATCIRGRARQDKPEREREREGQVEINHVVECFLEDQPNPFGAN